MALFDKQSNAEIPNLRLQFSGDSGQEYYENANGRTWTWATTNNEGLLQSIKPESSRSWTWVNAKNETIAYSIQIEPLVIADYAGDGSVRGIEILGKQDRKLEDYVQLAVQKSHGPVVKEWGALGSDVPIAQGPNLGAKIW